MDASSSTFDTAYNDFKIKIRRRTAWHTTTVGAYSVPLLAASPRTRM